MIKLQSTAAFRADGGIMTERDGFVPVNAMEIYSRNSDSFFLFMDIFVHAEREKITACAPHYGGDLDWSDHGIDLDQVELLVGDDCVIGKCIQHQMDSWEPAILFDFEGDIVKAAIQNNDSVSFRIRAGEFEQSFELSTEPHCQYPVTMSVIVKNENRWIRHYLDYYLRCMQVDHIYVYDNAAEPDQDLLDILDPYLTNKTVSYIPWGYRWRNYSDAKQIGQPPQQAHSLNRFPADWIGFFDVDEFLRIPGETLPEFLSDYDPQTHDGLSFGLRWFFYQGEQTLDKIQNPLFSMFHFKEDELGRKRQKLMVSRRNVRFLRFHWLEDGKVEIKIPDDEIFFHHYYLREERFEEGKQAPETHFDNYMLRFAHQLSAGNTRESRGQLPQTPAEWQAHLDETIRAAEHAQGPATETDVQISGRHAQHFINHLCHLTDVAVATQSSTDSARHADILILDTDSDRAKSLSRAAQLRLAPGQLQVLIIAGGDSSIREGIQQQLFSQNISVIEQHAFTTSDNLGADKWGAGVWIGLIQGAPANSSAPDKEMHQRVNVLVMSKDRAFQLEALLRSKQQHLKLVHETTVLYQTSDTQFANSYERLMTAYPDINWIKETNFREQLLDWLDQVEDNEHVMFLVDDIVFTKPYCGGESLFALEQEESILAVSLRLGSNVTWCHPRQIKTTPPDFSSDRRWSWREASSGYWNYPMSVDGNIFRAADLKPLLPELGFQLAPQLEASMAGAALNRELMICEAEPVLVNLAINRVQDVYQNPAGEVDPGLLNDHFLNGEVLDIEYVASQEYDSCHVEPEVRFVPVQPRTAMIEIDLRKIPVFVLNSPDEGDRRKFMEQQLDRLGVTPEFVTSMPSDPAFVGQAISHLRTIRQTELPTPFLVLEDDVQFTDDFQLTFSVPAGTDALYLGVSELGAVDAAPEKGASRSQQLNWNYRRIGNMWSRHAILYLSDEYKNACIDASMDMLTTQDTMQPVDVRYAELQQRFMVLAPEKLWCYQHETLSGNSETSKYFWKSDQEKGARRKAGKLPTVYLNGLTLASAYQENGISAPQSFQVATDEKLCGSDVRVLVNEAILSELEGTIPNTARRIAWIAESPSIAEKFGINEFVKTNLEKVTEVFDVLLTSDREMCQLHEKFVHHPAASNLPWIKTPKIHTKDKLCSMLATAKKLVPEQELRQHIAASFQSELDLFGGACQSQYLTTKHRALEPYMFSVNMENSRKSLYYSEKLTDCIATGTVPVYWGTEDIAELFDTRGIIFLDDRFKLNSLNPDLYESMLPYVEENFNRLATMESALDQLFRLYIEPSEIKLR